MVSHRHVAILPLSVFRGKKQIRREKSSALRKAVSQVAPALCLPDRCPSVLSHVLGSCSCRLPAASCHGYVIGTGSSFSMWSSQCEPILNKGSRRFCRSDILPLFTCSWYVLFTASCPIAFDRGCRPSSCTTIPSPSATNSDAFPERSTRRRNGVSLGVYDIDGVSFSLDS